MIGRRQHRPGYDGLQRRNHTYYEPKHENRFANVRWRCDMGLVHQASWHYNRTLCEMGSTNFVELLHLPIVEATRDRVNCVECMGYVTWRDYPVD